MIYHLSYQNLVLIIKKSKKKSYTKFLLVFLDVNLSWKKYLKYIENKIAKALE